MYSSNFTDVITTVAEPSMWRWQHPPVDVVSVSEVISTTPPQPSGREMVDVVTGQQLPEDEATKAKSIQAALKKLRATARRKPIGTVDDFLAERRAEAAME